MLTRSITLISLTLALLAVAHAQPTISGTNAFRYLGVLPTGVYSDGGSCSPPHTGPCYYTQTLLTASPSGGNYFNWSWSTTGAGTVTLSCTTNCANTVTVTATHASSGCSSDVSVAVSYNGGPTSAGYGLTIVTPTTATLSYGFPSDGIGLSMQSGSFQTVYNWVVTDFCGNEDTGIDQTEAFCAYPNEDNNCMWTADYSMENWVTPTPGAGYASSVLVDNMGQYDTAGTPATQTPATSGYNTGSTSVPVLHAPWAGYVGSLQTGCSGVAACGVQILSDTFQYYQDCGRHN